MIICRILCGLMLGILSLQAAAPGTSAGEALPQYGPELALASDWLRAAIGAVSYEDEARRNRQVHEMGKLSGKMLGVRTQFSGHGTATSITMAPDLVSLENGYNLLTHPRTQADLSSPFWYLVRVFNTAYALSGRYFDITAPDRHGNSVLNLARVGGEPLREAVRPLACVQLWRHLITTRNLSVMQQLAGIGSVPPELPLKDYDGNCLLHLAVKGRCMNEAFADEVSHVISFLLQANPSLEFAKNDRNNDFQTPLELAMSNGYGMSVLRLLAGSDIDDALLAALVRADDEIDDNRAGIGEADAGYEASSDGGSARGEEDDVAPWFGTI